MTDIEKLKEIINEIDILIRNRVKSDDQEFQNWHYKTKQFLRKKYGSDSAEYEEFTIISFELSLPTMYDTDSDKIELCYKGLVSAKAMLNALLSDLSEVNTDYADTSDHKKELERIFTRFKEVAVQLTKRHDNRSTIIIENEYDVQDLLHALLKLYFDDVRPEEWTPSYAGGAVRTDFLIPEIKTIIEVKKTRDSMNDKTVGEELIIDIEKYQSHPDCDKIYCFVYDPDRKLKNPAGIKKDLEKKHQGLVRVFIES